MIKKISLVFIVVSFCLLTAASAQEKAKSQTQSEPAQKQEVKTIFNYKTELELTDKQVEELKNTLTSFQQFLLDKKKELGLINSELATMIKEKADMKLIRNKLEQIAKIQVDVSYVDVETARKTEGVLTPGQLKKWKAMQEEFRSKASQK